MKVNIFHGSPSIIEKPIFGYGKPYNDYGLGFYCTYSLEMAKEWAASKDVDGYANCYTLDCTDLKILNINSDEYCILHWLAVLLENREFDVPAGLALEAKEYLLPVGFKHLNFIDENTVILIGDCTVGYSFRCCSSNGGIRIATTRNM